MAGWIDDDGELHDRCPLCEGTVRESEIQMHAMELELRRYRSRVTRLENEAEAAKVAKRDGKTWEEVLRCYRLAFPEKRLSATGIKSETATKVFERLATGTSVEDLKDAIAGAMQFPFVVFGKRTRSGSASDRADHLRDIVSVNNDANFDFLRDVGHTARTGS